MSHPLGGGSIMRSDVGDDAFQIAYGFAGEEYLEIHD